jgi:hypothetical protein
MRYIGIDPGQNLGLVCLDVEQPARRIGTALTIKWVSSARIHPGQRKDDTPAENDGRVFSRLAVELERLRTQAYMVTKYDEPALIAVLEEPYTHMGAWGAGRAQSRGTGFGLGKYYGLALAACTIHCDRVYSHPPTNDRKQQRTGWMQGSGRIQKRELTLLALRGLAKQCGAVLVDDISEDELMAFGVLHFHLYRQGLEQEQTKPS